MFCSLPLSSLNNSACVEDKSQTEESMQSGKYGPHILSLYSFSQISVMLLPPSQPLCEDEM